MSWHKDETLLDVALEHAASYASEGSTFPRITRKEVRRILNHLNNVTKVLKDIEWGPGPITDGNFCSWCLWDKLGGHSPDCELGLLLKVKI